MNIFMVCEGRQLRNVMNGRTLVLVGEHPKGWTPAQEWPGTALLDYFASQAKPAVGDLVVARASACSEDGIIRVYRVEALCEKSTPGASWMDESGGSPWVHMMDRDN
jgi:hypothetical protein